ncbi:hypothetical protein [Sulfurimonas paralvinellae]|uniref:hypothetical protein n=1 Tax=Sulfurimonas paralvinellae TaxID=317658 RepID=UPI001867552B|nr:hypothetical protein [Sulfurimonas paralvinellae]
MPLNTITIKPNNHRIYQCPNEKKTELLNKLINESDSEDIIVACSRDAKKIQEGLDNKEIRVLEDKEFVQDKDVKCAYLISYDMPIKDIVYIARVAKATQKAVMLLDESEQKELHAIETLLGRAIKQERIAGFEYEEKAKPKEPARKKLSKDEIKEVAKKRYEKSTQEKPKFDAKPKYDAKSKFDKPKKDDKFDKKKKAPKAKTTGKVIKVKAKKK